MLLRPHLSTVCAQDVRSSRLHRLPLSLSTVTAITEVHAGPQYLLLQLSKVSHRSAVQGRNRDCTPDRVPCADAPAASQAEEEANQKRWKESGGGVGPMDQW